MFTYIFLVVVVSIFFVLYYWPRKHLYAAASRLQGPPCLPFLGNAMVFWCRPEDMFQRLTAVLYKHLGKKEPMRFWLGPLLIIFLRNPVHLEKIMSSSKFATKSELMNFIKYFWGDGLISASGPKYRIHRRMIQPIFDINFAEKSLAYFHKHARICMEKLAETEGHTIDIFQYIIKFSKDLTGDIVAGQDIRSQELGTNDFCQSLGDMYQLCVNRMLKVWLHPDIIYNMLPDKKKSDKVVSDFNIFTQKAIDESNLRRKSEKMLNDDEFIPAIDIMTELSERNPEIFTNQDLKDHLITLYEATDDPLGLISSFSALCFGMYPEYQAKAVEEIRNVIGEKQRNITVDDLRNLTYLDMCVKDVLRLFPIAPFIIRRILDDYKLDKWIIPKGSTILVPIYLLHTDDDIWDNPHHFHPDHFLPEVVEKRHIYAYLPFSAGPRGCIGKTIANISIKIFLVHLLQTFEIEADGKVPDIELMSDISVRPKKGFNCRLKRRKWN